MIWLSGCGSVWLERLLWEQDVAGSNPVTPTKLHRYEHLGCCFHKPRSVCYVYAKTEQVKRSRRFDAGVSFVASAKIKKPAEEYLGG